MSDRPTALLEAKALSVEVPGLPGERQIGLRSVALSLARGELLVLAGESESGPPLLARLAGGLADPRTKILSGSLLFEGESILGESRRRGLERRRGPVAYLARDSATPPEPGRTVGQWLADCVGRKARAEARSDWADCFFRAGLLEPETLLPRRLEELPPATRRRLGVVRALLQGAMLLVCEGADEDLDPLSADLFLDLLARLRDEAGLGLLVVMETLRGVERFADRLAVFFDGAILECGPAAEVLASPRFAYTREFRDCSLRLGRAPRELPVIGREAIREAEEAASQAGSIG
jgi:ABC-type glutathione transport system ATPase component